VTDLPKYSWDQAAIAGLATAAGFTALFIPAATVRKWASRKKIKAVGLAPGGAKLYSIAEVSACARPTVTP
jgi:hypothetical protein